MQQINAFKNGFLKWIILCLIIGILTGAATAFFLYSLGEITNFRGTYKWIIYSLPIIGFAIGALYHYYGGEAKKGNNLLIEQYHSPQATIPFRMAPLVYIGTILTHLAGGSAGREGTAVQMGGAIADQFTKLFKCNKEERKTIIIIGISAGFAAVFGTPLAGALFALEIMLFKNVKLADLLPSFAAAYIAHFTCLTLGIQHTIYTISEIPSITTTSITAALLAGFIFGLAAFFFTQMNVFWSWLFKKIKYPPFRPFIGGIILLVAIGLLGTTKHIGLGIPTIIESFNHPIGKYDFFIKLLLTTFTLSAGFKGGEVTPLFFIGATLGNILIWFIPLPMALLAGMGLVAVFAGATHCVIASIVLGIELFGINAGVFIGIATGVAYFASGANGIYSAQLKEGAKYKFYNYLNRISKF
jgi:H+/Cl- antiporter ClcA